jgi:hypothetical protein
VREPPIRVGIQQSKRNYQSIEAFELIHTLTEYGSVGVVELKDMTDYIARDSVHQRRAGRGFAAAAISRFSEEPES